VSPPRLSLPSRRGLLYAGVAAALRGWRTGGPTPVAAGVAGLAASPGAMAAGLPAEAVAARPGDAATHGQHDAIARGRELRFPRDHGSHPGSRTEWWYVTGWLATDGRADAVEQGTAAPSLGFQITFFRSRTDVAPGHPSRFAAHQLLFAHLAVTDLRRPDAARLRHDQRIARAGFGIAEAALDDTRVHLRDWSLARRAAAAPSAAARYRMQARSEPARLSAELVLDTTQPVLLQGDRGFSRKGPLEEQASHYYSQPQLAVAGRLQLDGQPLSVEGRAWLDHEWSETLLAPEAVGWDWIGMNLFDGTALTAFRLRRTDGSALWAGGSVRRAGGGDVRAFDAQEVTFEPGQRWRSPSSGAGYPVQWQVVTPAGRFVVRALLDAQELDSRGSTGAIYWEGLSELLDEQGRRVGLGYLEMTGYAGRLQL
jgi:predicted secreted hydrolase